MPPTTVRIPKGIAIGKYFSAGPNPFRNRKVGIGKPRCRSGEGSAGERAADDACVPKDVIENRSQEDRGKHAGNIPWQPDAGNECVQDQPQGNETDQGAFRRYPEVE